MVKYLAKRKIEIIEHELKNVEMCMLYWTHGEMGYQQTQEELLELEQKTGYLEFIKQKIIDGANETAIIKELDDEIQAYAVELDYAGRCENGYDYSYEEYYARQAEQKTLIEKRNYLRNFMKKYFSVRNICGLSILL